MYFIITVIIVSVRVDSSTWSISGSSLITAEIYMYGSNVLNMSLAEN